MLRDYIRAVCLSRCLTVTLPVRLSLVLDVALGIIQAHRLGLGWLQYPCPGFHAGLSSKCETQRSFLAPNKPLPITDGVRWPAWQGCSGSSLAGIICSTVHLRTVAGMPMTESRTFCT